MCRSASIALLVLFFAGLSIPTQLAADHPDPFGAKTETVLFLGDSNTYAGGYVAMVEAQLRANDAKHIPNIINLGLPSETCSGLSEDIHPFPRPNVHERLTRALEKINPDVVFVCYGVNDGIYAPLHSERFDAYKNGLTKLVNQIEQSGAVCVVCTPPAFDPLPMKKKNILAAADAKSFSWKTIYEDYDSVMAEYSKWARSEFGKRLIVIDFHTAINAHTDTKRKDNPDFMMSGDGIHINQEGHQVLADAILDTFKIAKSPRPTAEILKKVTERQRVMKSAWLSEVGHKRPGVKPGLPLDEAKAKAAEIAKSLK